VTFATRPVPPPAVAAGAGDDADAPSLAGASYQTDDCVIHQATGCGKLECLNGAPIAFEFTRPIVACNAKPGASDLRPPDAAILTGARGDRCQGLLEALPTHLQVAARPALSETHRATLLVGQQGVALSTADVDAKVVTSSHQAVSPLTYQICSTKARSGTRGSSSTAARATPRRPLNGASTAKRS